MERFGYCLGLCYVVHHILLNPESRTKRATLGLVPLHSTVQRKFFFSNEMMHDAETYVWRR